MAGCAHCGEYFHWEHMLRYWTLVCPEITKWTCHGNPREPRTQNWHASHGTEQTY